MRSVTAPSSGRPARAHAELRLERLEDLLRADERTGDVRADLDELTADGLEVEHVVEARDAFAVRGRQVERVGDVAESLTRQVAVALLREPQRGKDSGLWIWVLARDLLHSPAKIRRILAGCHRSVSPITESSEPTIAIRSATRASRMQVAVASSATKDGARNLTRQGFAPPSETT